MNEKRNHLIIILTTILLLPVLVWITIISITTSETYFSNAFTKYNVAKNLDYTFEKIEGSEINKITLIYTTEDLKIVIKQLTDYLTLKVISPQVKINGYDVFSNQAIIHLQDVLDIYIIISILFVILSILIIMGFIYIIINYHTLKAYLFKDILKTTTIIFIVIILLSVIIYINYDFSFTVFHRLIFFNDTKFNDAFFSNVSNYPEEVYINNLFLVDMLPLEVFINATIILSITVIVGYAIWLIGGYFLSKKSEI